MFTSRTRTAAVAVLATASLSAALGIFANGASAATPQSGVAITGLSVVKGATTATTSTLITGTGFSKLTDVGVKFGAKASDKVIVLSDTQIAAVAPTNDPGPVNVTLTDTVAPADGETPADVATYGPLEAPNAAKDDFTYLVPYNASIATGTLLNSVGGGKLTVTSSADMGADATIFTTTNKVTATVNGAVTPVTWKDKNTALVTVPAGTPSNTAPKVVLLHDGVAGAPATQARYAAVITATDKVGGPLAGSGNEVVTITGKGLTGATNWKFGTEAGIDCANVVGSVDTKVTCKVPAAAGTAENPAVPGTVNITFTPKDAPYGATSKATWTYSDLV